MSLRKVVPLGALLALLLVAGAGAAHRATWKVTSSLDGKKVLPRRVVWTGATRGLPRDEFKIFDFLIDGKIVSFTEANPGRFPEKDGFLVTSWLKPGPHMFTVRARAKDHTIVDDNVTANVVAGPAPPTALAGTWERTITDTSAAPKMGSPGNPTDTATPPGTYQLTFEPRWIQARFPGKFNPATAGKTGNGLILDNDWTPGATSFQAWGGVQFKAPQVIDAEGGWWCLAGGPESDYSWSVSGKTLTLTPKGGSDACVVRGFIWTGQWTRVG